MGNCNSIRLGISNAILWVRFSNTSFKNDGQPAREIVTTRSETVGGNMIREHIVRTAISIFDESEMVLKMYNDNYSDTSRRAFFTEIRRILF